MKKLKLNKYIKLICLRVWGNNRMDNYNKWNFVKIYVYYKLLVYLIVVCVLVLKVVVYKLL